MFTSNRIGATKITTVVLLLLGTGSSRYVRAEGDADIFYKLTLSSVLVLTVSDEHVSYGTGWIIDYRNGYLVTDEHVVHGHDAVGITFPEFRDGRVIDDFAHYGKRKRIVKGTVVATDKERDLAIIKVGSIPSYMRALRLTTDTLDEGDPVYTIGNRIHEDRVFIPRKGKVLFHGFSVEMKEGKTVLIGDLLYTRSEFIQGNSGGPIVGETGALVGVVTAINPNEQYNVNTASMELQRWLGLSKEGRTIFDYETEKKSEDRRMDIARLNAKPLPKADLNGRWVATIREELKAKDSFGEPLTRKRLAGIEILHKGISSPFKSETTARIFSLGRKQEFTLKFPGETRQSSGRVEGYITVLRYVKVPNEKTEADETVADQATRNGNQSPVQGFSEEHDDAFKELLDSPLLKLKTDSFGHPYEDSLPGDDFVELHEKFRDVDTGKVVTFTRKPQKTFDPLLAGLALPWIELKTDPLFGSDGLPFTMFGSFYCTPKSYFDRTTRTEQPKAHFSLDSKDPKSDWTEATWNLTLHAAYDTVGVKLKMQLGENRPYPRPASLPLSR